MNNQRNGATCPRLHSELRAEPNWEERGGWKNLRFPKPRPPVSPREDHVVLWLSWAVLRAANGSPINFNHLLSPLRRVDFHSFLIQLEENRVDFNPKLKLHTWSVVASESHKGAKVMAGNHRTSQHSQYLKKTAGLTRQLSKLLKFNFLGYSASFCFRKKTNVSLYYILP